MLLHIRNESIPILAESEFSLFTGNDEVSFELAHEPVCNTVVISAETNENSLKSRVISL